jgi:superfamily II DNA or RNA helicase
VNLYEWQESLYNKWKQSGFIGILKAVPGAGKTIAGIAILDRLYREEWRGIYDDVTLAYVICPSTAIIKQWKDAIDGKLFARYVKFYTMDKMVNIVQERLIGLDDNLLRPGQVDVLIVDEAHRLSTNIKSSILHKLNYNRLLGFTATPDADCLINFKCILDDVGFDEANIAPFEVIFHDIFLSKTEREKHDKITETMNKWPRGTKQYERFVFKRRGMVYGAESRFPLAIRVVMNNLNDKILILTQRIDHANDIYEQLKEKGLNVGVTHSKKKNNHADLFKSGDIRYLVAVRALNEGYDVPDITRSIIVSPATTLTNHIQTLGRSIRFSPDKFAYIHIFVARDTSDEVIYKHRHLYKHTFAD